MQLDTKKLSLLIDGKKPRLGKILNPYELEGYSSSLFLSQLDLKQRHS
jgi:hypothetical protein